MRKYLPTISELIDRLSIVQLKEVFIPEHKEEYAKEIQDIVHDLDELGLLKEYDYSNLGKLIRAVIVLSQMNLHIWHNETKYRKGEGDGNLGLTHGLNGIRNTAKNIIQDQLDGDGRKDYKVDCIAAEFDDWDVSWQMSVYQSSVYKKNEVWEWCNPDSKELFEKNCKKYPNNKSLKYYKENPIEYSFNNYGFRTPDDFNDKDDGNVFLGCSDTMGVGNHLENTWPYKVNKEVGGKFWNLSQAGSGIQTDFRLLYGFKDYLKKSILIVKYMYHL